MLILNTNFIYKYKSTYCLAFQFIVTEEKFEVLKAVVLRVFLDLHSTDW
jgi:hypothetical protein